MRKSSYEALEIQYGLKKKIKDGIKHSEYQLS